MYITSTLSVSRKERLNCEDMAIFLSKSGVFTSITSNISTNPHIEYGCIQLLPCHLYASLNLF